MKIALIQQRAEPDRDRNISRGVAAVRNAAASGSQVVCFAELAFDRFFPQVHAVDGFESLAEPVPGPTTDIFSELAGELGIVIILNLFEIDGADTYDSSPVFDVDGNDGKLKEITILMSRISTNGADTTPIDPYFTKLETAYQDRDQVEFESTYESVRPWLEDYLSSVQMNEIEKIIDRVQEALPIFKEIGNVDLPLKAREKVERIRLTLAEADVSDLEKAIEELTDLEKRVEKARKRAVDQAREMVIRKRGDIEKKVERHANDLRVDNYSQVLVRIEDILKDDPIKANMMIDDLNKTIEDHLRNLALKRLDRFLLSVEPLIRKVGALEGTDSDLYLSLIAQKEELLRISEEDVNQALFQMEVLLDKAATTVTQAEERRSEYLKSRIDSEKEKAMELPEDDRSKLMTILGKAETALLNGEMDQSESLVGRALTAYERIRERHVVRELTDQLKGYESVGLRFREIALDTTRMDEIVDKARNLIRGYQLEQVDEVFDLLTDEIKALEVEEVKIRYQQMMIPVVNTIRDLKEEGRDVTSFSEILDEIKSTFNNRDYESALDGLESIKSEIDRIRMERSVREKAGELSESLDEADDLGVRTSPFRDRLVAAESLLSQGSIEEAMESISGIRSDLEEELLGKNMKGLEREIGDLVADCIGGGIDTNNVEPDVKGAYDMVSDGRIRDAIVRMKEIRDDLHRRSSGVRTKRLIDEFRNKIIRARILGIDVSEYRAAATKAAVRLTANDIKGALNEVEDRMKALDDLIIRREKDNESADEIRGTLIAQEGRINILLEKDVQVIYLKEWVTKIKSLLDQGMADEAAEELKELDRSITTVFRSTQERTDTVPIVESPPEEPARTSEPVDISRWIQRPKPLSIEPIGRKPVDPVFILSPNQARTELEKLIPLIKKAIETKVEKGEATESYRDDLSKIKEMFLQKNYMEAYRIANTCLKAVDK